MTDRRTTTPYVLTGKVNDDPVAVPMTSIGDTEQYVDSIEWWIHRHGGKMDLSLKKRDGEVIQTYKLERETGAMVAVTLKGLI